MVRLSTFFLSTAILVGIASVSAEAVLLIDGNTPGYYNASLGTVLDGTNPCFPFQPSFYGYILVEPVLSAAAPVLGGWLQDPPVLPTPFWSATPIPIPFSWQPFDETAIVYEFEVPGTRCMDLQMLLGADNNIMTWLDGEYTFGQGDEGGPYFAEYSHTIYGVTPGIHHLQVLREDHGGSTGYYIEVTGTPAACTAGTEDRPAAFELSTAHPNPFNPTTTLDFSLPATTLVELAVYNVAGQRVATLVDGLQSAGVHSLTFDAAALPSGMYFARMAAMGEVQTTRMLLLK